MTYHSLQGPVGNHQTACAVAGQGEGSVQEDLTAYVAEGLEVATALAPVVPSQARPELLRQP